MTCIAAYASAQSNNYSVVTKAKSVNSYVKLANGYWLKMNDLGWRSIAKDNSQLSLKKTGEQKGNLYVAHSKDAYAANPQALKTVSIFENSSIVRVLEKDPTETTDRYTVFYSSNDKGESWDSIIAFDALDFGNVYDVVQTTSKDIILTCSKLVPDSTDPWNRWRPKFYLKHSSDFCQTWKEYDLKMPINSRPSEMTVDDNQIMFFTNAKDSTFIWYSNDFGKTWNQSFLTKDLEGVASISPHILVKDDLYAVTHSSIQYFNSLKSPNLGQHQKVHEEFHGSNCIMTDTNNIWSAYPKPAGIGNLSRSFIVGKIDNQWKVVLDKLEPESEIYSRGGLMQNAYYESEAMAFLGPKLIYFSFNKNNNWHPYYPPDTLRNGTNGAVMMKDGTKYHVLYSLKAQSELVKYTLPQPTSIVDNEKMFNGNLSVYPNPSNGFSVIQIDNASENLVAYEIYTLSGQQVQNGNLVLNDNGTGNINYQTLPKGVYILKLYADGQEQSLKLFKK